MEAGGEEGGRDWMMEEYQWWWEENSEGLRDAETWTTKVCGRSDDKRVEGRRKMERKKRKKTEEIAIGDLCLVPQKLEEKISWMR